MPDVYDETTIILQGELFRQVREALGLSVIDMQDALCILDVKTVQRFESGEIDVYGSTWVALWYMLEERADELELGEPDSARIEQLDTLMDQVISYQETLRQAAMERREAARIRRRDRQQADVAEELES